MASVFSRIIAGELPGRFVYRDAEVVAFLTIAPLKPGHTLVVPVREVDHWLDLPPELTHRLFATAQTVGQAIDRAFRPRRVAAVLLGLEVPHVHVHLIPIDREAEVNFALIDHHPDPAALDAAAARIRGELPGSPAC
ncbi:MAG: HIT family protein [Mycobacteriales bacterium]